MLYRSKNKDNVNKAKKTKGDKKLVALSKKVLTQLKIMKESTGTEVNYFIKPIL